MRTIAWDIEVLRAPSHADDGVDWLVRGLLWLEDGTR
jgi:hypothetical protein